MEANAPLAYERAKASKVWIAVGHDLGPLSGHHNGFPIATPWPQAQMAQYHPRQDSQESSDASSLPHSDATSLAGYARQRHSVVSSLGGGG